MTEFQEFRNRAEFIDATRALPPGGERDRVLVDYVRKIKDDLGVEIGDAFKIAAMYIETAPEVYGPEHAAPELAQRVRQLAFE
jgi:hypothetical protein